MAIEYIIAFNLASLVAVISPGPAFLYLVKVTLSSGRRAGVVTACGLGLMASTWTLMALLGLDGIFRLFPWAYAAFKFGGAVYLLYIAWGMWRHAHDSIENRASKSTRVFLGGILVNLANPKSVLFATAVLVVIFPPDLTMANKAIIVVNHLTIEIIVYSVFAIFLSTKTVARQYLRQKHIADRFAAVVLGGLGLRLMADR